VIFVIRTRVFPFYRSRPSRLLFTSTILVMLVACILPFTAIGNLFGFVHLPAAFFVALIGLVAGYLVIVDLAKRWFFNRYSGFVEQRVAKPVAP